MRLEGRVGPGSPHALSPPPRALNALKRFIDPADISDGQDLTSITSWCLTLGETQVTWDVKHGFNCILLFIYFSNFKLWFWGCVCVRIGWRAKLHSHNMWNIWRISCTKIMMVVYDYHSLKPRYVIKGLHVI